MTLSRTRSHAAKIDLGESGKADGRDVGPCNFACGSKPDAVKRARVGEARGTARSRDLACITLLERAVAL